MPTTTSLWESIFASFHTDETVDIKGERNIYIQFKETWAECRASPPPRPPRGVWRSVPGGVILWAVLRSNILLVSWDIRNSTGSFKIVKILLKYC